MREITLPDSGVTLQIERVAPFLLSDIRSDISTRYPKPKPPVIKVRLGLEGEEIEQENKADPAYQFDLQQHRITEGRAFIEALVEVSTQCEVNAEKVKTIRAWAERRNIELPSSDVVLYVTRVALETSHDVDVFKDAVLGMSQPSEKGVEQSLATFRPSNGHGSKLPDLQGT